MCSFHLQNLRYLYYFLAGNGTRFWLIYEVIRVIEAHIAQFEYTAHKQPNLINLSLGKAYRLKGSIDLREIFGIIDMRRLVTATLFEQLIVGGYLHVVLIRSHKCIKGVKATLVLGHRDHSWFLQEVAVDVGALYHVVGIEVYLHELTESTWILVTDSLAVPECLQDRIAG